MPGLKEDVSFDYLLNFRLLCNGDIRLRSAMQPIRVLCLATAVDVFRTWFLILFAR